MKKYLDYLELPKDQRGPKHLYGRVLTCPDSWRQNLRRHLPEDIKPLGKNDLMGTKSKSCQDNDFLNGALPENMQTDDFVYYIGKEGTRSEILLGVSFNSLF